MKRSSSGTSFALAALLAAGYAAYLVVTWSPAGGRFGGGLFPAGSPLWWIFIGLLSAAALWCGYRAVRPANPLN